MGAKNTQFQRLGKEIMGILRSRKLAINFR
jgi:hypothetical protein